MNRALLDGLIHALLYEGHILYPYRASSCKNRQRFTFGRVYPREYSAAQKDAEPCFIQAECLLEGLGQGSAVTVRVAFLQPMLREIGISRGVVSIGNTGADLQLELVPELRVDGVRYQPWHEATERSFECTVTPEAAALSGHVGEAREWAQEFEHPASWEREQIRGRDGTPRGVILRRQEAVKGRVEIGMDAVGEGLWKLCVRVWNMTPVAESDLANSEAVLMRTFASTHIVLSLTGGADSSAFVSLLDPAGVHAPAEAVRAAAARCRNVGVWPVLVGEENAGERDTMLASPIILYDYPKIAPESPGDLFDGTEIDEILTLRVMTMTDDEKAEMRGLDQHARRLLERTESISCESLARLHGVLREPDGSGFSGPSGWPHSAGSPGEAFFNPTEPQEGAAAGGVLLRAGARVRLRPKHRADVFDIALAGRVGVVEAVEHDLEGKAHFAVVIEDDPGRELGTARFPGHRFFFAADEVEPLEEMP